MKSEPVPFAGQLKVPSDDCEEAFFAAYPDFFYEGSTALNLWTQAWFNALDWAEENKSWIKQI